MIKKVVAHRTRKKCEVCIEKVHPSKIYAQCDDDGVVKLIKKLPGKDQYYFADLTCEGCWSAWLVNDFKTMFSDDYGGIQEGWFQFDNPIDFASWIYKLENQGKL